MLSSAPPKKISYSTGISFVRRLREVAQVLDVENDRNPILTICRIPNMHMNFGRIYSAYKYSLPNYLVSATFSVQNLTEYSSQYRMLPRTDGGFTQPFESKCEHPLLSTSAPPFHAWEPSSSSWIPRPWRAKLQLIGCFTLNDEWNFS